ncbi:YceI family protein [Hyphococcus sp.]|uniref:YceI family protein n=1 Tax=Hyphococcus sp. TaxID=2038636 RepID=UPI00208AABCA|nr:MAG: polyisoprenoid-binding protein [Marinicaulis sp.]
MSFIRLLIITSWLFVSGCASALAPLVKPDVEQGAAALRSGAYELDTDHAALLFQVNHLGFSEFAGRFDRFNVSLDFDDQNPEAANIDAMIDMTSLDVANDAFAETLMGPQWFDAAAFPQARFTSTAITVTGENNGILNGNLTLHGVTAPVTLDVAFNGGARDRLRNAYVTGFSARGVISRAAFGVDRFSTLVGDEVKIEIQAEFKKR